MTFRSHHPKGSELLELILACTGLACLLASPILGFYAGRRAAIDAYSDLSVTIERESLAAAGLRDQVVEMLERTTVERRRIAGERSRIDQTKQAQEAKSNGAEQLAGLDHEAQIESVRDRYEGR